MGYSLEHAKSYDGRPAYTLLHEMTVVGEIHQLYCKPCFFAKSSDTAFGPTNLRQIADIIELVEQVEKADSVRRSEQESSS